MSAAASRVLTWTWAWLTHVLVSLPKTVPARDKGPAIETLSDRAVPHAPLADATSKAATDLACSAGTNVMHINSDVADYHHPCESASDGARMDDADDPYAVLASMVHSALSSTSALTGAPGNSVSDENGGDGDAMLPAVCSGRVMCPYHVCHATPLQIAAVISQQACSSFTLASAARVTAALVRGASENEITGQVVLLAPAEDVAEHLLESMPVTSSGAISYGARKRVLRCVQQLQAAHVVALNAE